jgi:hypothetical protein
MRLPVRNRLANRIPLFGAIVPVLIFAAISLIRVPLQASNELTELALQQALIDRWTILDDSLPLNACSVYYGLRTDSLVTSELRALVSPLDQSTARRCGSRQQEPQGSNGAVYLDSVSFVSGGQQAVVQLSIVRRGGLSFPERHHLQRLPIPPPSRLRWGHESILIGIAGNR